ncbi:geranylgeranyl transferase type-2 subunit alpha-like [Corticium candelabrum]|uniref:geranylgeranyl transferase type-2 subunit alpha-like n=1 Tax=Corticium candelabrum TaxID=121492 RepID=UPI002E2740CA|nr:geranylgeranyl transferase type-2 subunit alpha-like [Corticium candelabrum]
MHGRVKVKTTEEQAEAKKKERQQKLKKFEELTNTIYRKRGTGELDSDMLQLTQHVLSANPDYYTLWNIRRETMDKLVQANSADVGELYGRELRFLESCLQVNPKSYSVFLQRRWVMTRHPSPDWKSELSLCDTFLRYDERNFHCWDYRRFVVKQAGIGVQDEFEFTDKKIKSNFSNYSAWHYRSKLLPKVYPDLSNKERPTEDALLAEHQYVQNAFFTDPSDQSAWFYHRWLLGRTYVSCDILCAHVSSEKDSKLVLSISLCQPLEAPDKYLKVMVNQAAADCVWHSLDVPAQWPALVWSTSLKVSELTIWPLSIEIQNGNHNVVLLLNDGHREAWWVNVKKGDGGVAQLTIATAAVLQEELESCKQLAELEPDNKWTLLTLVFLMRCLNMRTYFSDIITLLHKLESIDSYRSGYFRDLKNCCVVEKQIHSFYQDIATASKETSCRKLSFSKLNLVRLIDAHQLCLVTELDISHNQLTDLRGCQCIQCLEHLNADDNKLEKIGCSLGHLPRLSLVSLRNNRLSTLASLHGVLQLENTTLLLQGNSLLNSDDVVSELNRSFPGARVE